MNKSTNFAAFVLGIAVGSFVTWQYVKDRYEKIAQEEIDSVKERFASMQTANNTYIFKKNDESSVETENKSKTDTKSVAEYAKELSKHGYTKYSDAEEPDDEMIQVPSEIPSNIGKEPYVIPPENYGELADYDQITLVYYADRVLVCDDEKIEDIDGTVGLESLNHFGEYDDSSVHVRNDRLKVDYEILLDQRTYSEILEMRPYLKEE